MIHEIKDDESLEVIGEKPGPVPLEHDDAPEVTRAPMARTSSQRRDRSEEGRKAREEERAEFRARVTRSMTRDRRREQETSRERSRELRLPSTRSEISRRMHTPGRDDLRDRHRDRERDRDQERDRERDRERERERERDRERERERLRRSRDVHRAERDGERRTAPSFIDMFAPYLPQAVTLNHPLFPPRHQDQHQQHHHQQHHHHHHHPIMYYPRMGHHHHHHGFNYAHIAQLHRARNNPLFNLQFQDRFVEHPFDVL